jgi:hypothetical protein
MKYKHMKIRLLTIFLICTFSRLSAQPLVDNVHSASLQQRKQQLNAAVSKESIWPYNVWGDMMWSLSLLYLDARVDDANARILKYAESGGEPFAYFGLVDYVRILCMFHSTSEHFPGRLNSVTEEAMKRVVWDVVNQGKYVTTPGSRMIMASPERVWFVHGSENHDLINKVNHYLILSVLNEDTAYNDRLLPDNATVSEHFEAWNLYFKAWLRARATRGWLVELGSDIYRKYTYSTLFNLHDLSPDPHVRKLAEMLLDIAFIEEEQISFPDGFRGGGKSRVTYTKDLLTKIYSDIGKSAGFEDVKNLFHGFKGGASHSKVFETSSYQLPELAINIRRLGHSKYPLIIRNRVAGENVYPKPANALDDEYVLSDHSGLVNYCYRTPYFMLGSTLQDPKVFYSAISMQNRWSGVVFNDNDHNRVIPHPEPTRPESTRTHDAYWNVQYENIMIVQKLAKSNYTARMRVYFSPGLMRTEHGGWVFVSSGEAYAAIRPVASGYTWDTSAGWTGKDSQGHPVSTMMILNNDYDPVIFYAANKSDHQSFDEFMDFVLAASLTFPGGQSFLFKIGNIPEIKYFTNYQMPLIDGVKQNVEPPMAYDSPYLQSEWGSGIVTARWGDKSWIYDFNELTTSVKSEIDENKGLLLVKIFPNPARNELKVEFKNLQVKEISIIDIHGRNLLTRLIRGSQEGSVLLNVSQLNPGLYFIRISGKYETISKKFMIAKDF